MDLTRATWRKSSYSGSNGGACVEIALTLPGERRAIAARAAQTPVDIATQSKPG